MIDALIVGLGSSGHHLKASVPGKTRVVTGATRLHGGLGCPSRGRAC